MEEEDRGNVRLHTSLDAPNSRNQLSTASAGDMMVGPEEKQDSRGNMVPVIQGFMVLQGETSHTHKH